MTFLRITNEPRDYAWGSAGEISRLLGRPATEAIEAELWLGAHPGSPARTETGQPLGAALAEGEQGPLTILLKVLAAAQPLSLQVHPRPDQAALGFRGEEEAGVPRDASHRNYKDPYAKPEVIVAVTPFAALSGVRDPEAARAAFAGIPDDRIAPVLEALEGGTAAAVEWMLAGGDEVDAAVAAVTEHLDALAVVDAPAADTARRILKHYPGDPGLLVSVLLHRVDLAPGEALFLDAGNIHAYLEGLGIELMQASDNVLRAGLTPKHVDVPELLRIADFTPLADPRLQPEQLPGAVRYAPEAPFELFHITEALELPAGDVSTRGILLAIAETEVRIDGQTHTLPAGEAAYLRSASGVSLRTSDGYLALEV